MAVFLTLLASSPPMRARAKTSASDTEVAPFTLSSVETPIDDLNITCRRFVAASFDSTETAPISANNRLAALSASFLGTLTLIPAT